MPISWNGVDRRHTRRRDAEVLAIPADDLDALLDAAAQRGAKRALELVGLGGENAAADVHDLRGLLVMLRDARKTVLRVTITVVLTTLLGGIALIARWKGG